MHRSDCGDLKYFLWLQSIWGCILLVHWFDWYDWHQWNNISSIDILLVKCISLQGLQIYILWLQSAWGCILLVHWSDWYDLYQWNINYSIGILLVKCISLRGLKNIYVSFRLSGAAFYLSIGPLGTISTNGISIIPLIFHW